MDGNILALNCHLYNIMEPVVIIAAPQTIDE